MSLKIAMFAAVGIVIAVVAAALTLPAMSYEAWKANDPALVEYSVSAYIEDSGSEGEFTLNTNVEYNDTDYLDYMTEYYDAWFDEASVSKGGYEGPIIQTAVWVDGESRFVTYDYYTFGDGYTYADSMYIQQGSTVELKVTVYAASQPSLIYGYAATSFET